MKVEIKSITVFSRKNFRKWLEKNHEKESKVAVTIYKKHTGKSSPSHKELIEEAICFGWIDTTIKRIDEEKFLRNFSKRNKNSKWSSNTLAYAKDLTKRGLMKPAGLKYYNEGLSRPTHDHGIPKNPSMPKELKERLKKNKTAWTNFNNFSPSAKRTFYRWLLRIKGEETRKKRIKQIIAMSMKKEKIDANTKINQ